MIKICQYCVDHDKGKCKQKEVEYMKICASAYDGMVAEIERLHEYIKNLPSILQEENDDES